MVIEIDFGGFLRELFGPFQGDIWQEFSADMGYAFIKGNWLAPHQVEADILEHTVTMDVVQRGRYSTNTRLQAVVANPHQLSMKIYRDTGLGGIGKLFGRQDVEVGYPQLDQDFIIKGNDEALLRQICSNYLIRSLLFQEQESVRLDTNQGDWDTQLPAGKIILQLEVAGVVKDPPRLAKLFTLMAEALTEFNQYKPG